MSKNDPIMQRMKSNYENRSKTYLTRRTPVIIRIDGRAFHTYTKGLDKPFDEGLIEDMAETTKFLCENIQGAKIGYCQSDEISILLTDYDDLNTQAWFDYSVQKMVSISASLATGKFNQLRCLRGIKEVGSWMECLKEVKTGSLANFDARVFSMPVEEVSNYFLARQRDAVKNSVSMLAQSLYSHSELHGKNQSDLQEMCFQKGCNWNDLHWSKKRGSTIVKNLYINNIIVGDGCDKIWYQPENESIFYPSKNGRALQYTMSSENEYDWCDVEIKKIRSSWECIETPVKFDYEYFKSLTTF